MIAQNEGTFAGFGGLELYYQRRQTPERARGVVAIVHGAFEHSGRYNNIVDPLVPEGFSIYRFDLRGHGRSLGQRGHINRWEDFREDLHAFLQMVRDQEPDLPLFLFGHSLGGLIVLDYCLHYPTANLKGVIVSAPVLSIGISPLLLILSGLLSGIWPRFSLSVNGPSDLISRDPEVVKDYINDPLNHKKGTARAGAELPLTITWTQEHAAEWIFPLLMIHGTADRLIPPEGGRLFFSKVKIADKERIEYEGSYHETHNDLDREKVVSDLLNWLTQRS